MRREYFTIDESGHVWRTDRDSYIDLFVKMKKVCQDEIEISCRDFGACKIEFFYVADSLTGFEVSYVDPQLSNELSDPGEVMLRERV